MTLRAEWDSRVYNWLTEEASVHLVIHSGLMRVHEQARANSELFPLEAARFQERRREPNETEAALRLELFRLRAKRATLHLLRERLVAETTYRQASSIRLGLHKLYQDTSRQVGAIARGDIIVNEDFKQGGFQTQVAALAAVAYKVSGDSLSLLVTTPLEDGFIELLFKPLIQSLGGDVESSVDTQWKAYEEHAKESREREALFLHLSKDMKYAEGLDFIHYIRTGEKRGRSIATIAPLTTRFLLEDPAFIAGTQGGLPAMFTISPHSRPGRRGLRLFPSRRGE